MASSNKPSRGHVIACSHGAGPLVLLGADHQQPLIGVLEQERPLLDNAQGIILFTAHWETDEPTISAAAQHELLFDYPKTLPQEAFEVTYPAPGHPQLARKIEQKLEAFGFKPQLDHERGWDHGVFVPMTYLRPQADLPIVQMSVLKTQDAETHIRMGQALGSLRDEGFAIVCSGSSFHNLNEMMSSIKNKVSVPGDNHGFEAALEAAMMIPDAAVRLEKLKNWRTFPNNEFIHPPKHAEHFMPFMVAAGAGAPDMTTKGRTWNLYGADFSTYSW
ncbi:hypothetical protein OIDMADRAFT_35727 [Oidiodendron maius Zn]|uniref:Extradiol ring-cleavage dioxygenase class III enzyme subunit B domain-containing protein n=1 Tax=Oidiodendron maius (strain Zn) TaxID=913774 RepID=A0A0C3C3D0_OIDMZ|nr:hypothetical protein OIDMADRAFT_35727 [Oidiodendron maius Zn]